MEIVPVIDLLDGKVVHAVGGERSNYEPIQSKICSSPVPFEVARSFAAKGFQSAYVADLNALQGGDPDLESLAMIAQQIPYVMWDRGIRDTVQANEAAICAATMGIEGVVLALESLEGFGQMVELIQHFDMFGTVFSLDLKHGELLTSRWNATPLQIVSAVVGLGMRRLIVLDLAQVGTQGGLSVLELCRQIRDAHPDLELISGGGVRNQQDLDALAASGVDRALVATALHQGAI